MADPRVEKLARLVVNYSLELQPAQQFWLRTTPLAEDLNLAVYEEAIRAGAHVLVDQRMPGSEEIFFKYASDEQLDFVSPVRKMIVESFDASLYIEALHNSRFLAGVDSSRVARSRKAMAPLSTRLTQRSADGAHRWCLTVYPTNAMAQDANMSLADYRDFVYGAGMLEEEDPVEGGPDCRRPEGPAPEAVHLDDVDGLLTLCRQLMQPRLPWATPWQDQQKRLRRNLAGYRRLLKSGRGAG